MNGQTADLPSTGLFCQLVSDILEGGGLVRCRAHGGSMTPSIRDGDVIRAEPVVPAHLRLGDVVLYRDAGGRLLAHRVVGPLLRRECGALVIVKGDALRGRGERIRGEWILGRVVGVERGGRVLPMGVGLSRRRGLVRAWGLRLPVRCRRTLSRARCGARELSRRGSASRGAGSDRGVC